MAEEKIYLTIDVDWAPDFMIAPIAERLVEQEVKAVWFITHDSPAIRDLKKNPDLFELGIHPNFLAQSTHGATPEQVIEYCMSLVPEAVSMRTHCLFQSTPLFEKIVSGSSIQIDSSLYIPHPKGLQPFDLYVNGRRLIRVPHFFQDDFMMGRPDSHWDLHKLLAEAADSIKVFDFHPVHIFLNSAGLGAYHQLRRDFPWMHLVSPSAAAQLVNRGKGTGSLFEDLLTHLACSKNSGLLRELLPGSQSSICLPNR